MKSEIQVVTAYKCPETGKLFESKESALRSLRGRRAAAARAKNKLEREKARQTRIEQFPNSVDSIESAFSYIEGTINQFNLWSGVTFQLTAVGSGSLHGPSENGFRLRTKVSVKFDDLENVHHWDIERAIFHPFEPIVRTGYNRKVDKNNLMINVDLDPELIPAIKIKMQEYLSDKSLLHDHQSELTRVRLEGRIFSNTRPEIKHLESVMEFYRTQLEKCQHIHENIYNTHANNYLAGWKLANSSPIVRHTEMFGS